MLKFNFISICYEKILNNPVIQLTFFSKILVYFYLKKKKKKSKYTANKEIFKEFMTTTTFHGCLPLLQKSQTLIKVMWLFFILLSFAIFVFMFQDSIAIYLEYNVLSRVTYEEHVTKYLPALTLCIAFNNQLNINQILVACKFNKTSDCNSSMFQELYLFDNKKFSQKKCYRINGLLKNEKEKYLKAGGSVDAYKKKTLIYSDEIGYTSGLTLKFFLPKDDFLNYFTSDNEILPVLDELSHVLVPGKEINVLVSKSHTQKLPSPYNRCFDDTERSKNYWKFEHYGYRQINCLEYCRLEYYKKECQTFQPNMTSHELDPCLTSADKRFASNEKSRCEEQCLLECDHDEFPNQKEYLNKEFTAKVHASVTTALNVSLTNLSLAELTNRYLEINLFYGTTKYAVLTEKAAMTQVDLLASAGGLVGLFLGGSMLSLLEIVTIWIEILFVVLESKSGDNVQN